MCRRRFAAQAAEEVHAVELARQHAEQEVAAFEREGEVAQEAMDMVMEEATAVAADVAVGKMHAAAARKAVEAVAMEAAMAALRAMRNDAAMVSLEVVAKEAAKVAMRELRDGVVVHEAEAALMYIDDAVAEESRVATVAVMASGTSTWLLVDDDEKEVDDEDEEAAAERDAELRVADAAIREATTKSDAEMEARAWQDRYDRRYAEDLAEARVKVEAALASAEAKRVAAEEAAEREAADRAAHWAAEMDKALAYRRDVNRREACRRAQTEHRLERGRTVRRQDAAIRAAMAAIDAAGNDDGAALL
jgi:hypothetical protein